MVDYSKFGLEELLEFARFHTGKAYELHKEIECRVKIVPKVKIVPGDCL